MNGVITRVRRERPPGQPILPVGKPTVRQLPSRHRRPSLRVEELTARALPAVLNPAAVDVVGDECLVSTAEEETLSAEVTAGETADIGVEPVDDSMMFWSGMALEEGTEDVVLFKDDAQPVDETFAEDFVPADETGAEGGGPWIRTFGGVSSDCFRGGPVDGESEGDPPADDVPVTDDPSLAYTCFLPMMEIFVPAELDGVPVTDDPALAYTDFAPVAEDFGPADEPADSGTDAPPRIMYSFAGEFTADDAPVIDEAPPADDPTLAYTSFLPVAPPETEVPATTGPVIDASAWSFFSSHADDVLTADAPASDGDTTDAPPAADEAAKAVTAPPAVVRPETPAPADLAVEGLTLSIGESAGKKK